MISMRSTNTRTAATPSDRILRRLRRVQLVGVFLVALTVVVVPLLIASGAQEVLASTTGATASAGDGSAAALSALGRSLDKQHTEARIHSTPASDTLSQLGTIGLRPFAHARTATARRALQPITRTPVLNSDVLLL